ncbi:MAG: AAA family ATPase [Deltaproteobacteria bacterium]|nr:AAA family ATPase [Deltaproteobacteria bacterium]
MRRERALAKSAPATDRTEEKPRALTVLFCDLVGSTQLSSQLDPEDWREIVQRYHDCAAAVVQQFSGHVAQYAGDGLLACFGWPHAQDDDPERAVRAGLSLVAAVRALDVSDPSPGVTTKPAAGTSPSVRVAVHTGGVVVARRTGDERSLKEWDGLRDGASRRLRADGEVLRQAEETAHAENRRQAPLEACPEPRPRAAAVLQRGADIELLGDGPNVAMRLQAVAAPDTVVISRATLLLLPEDFVGEDLGPQPLAGIAAPVLAYRVTAPAGTALAADTSPRAPSGIAASVAVPAGERRLLTIMFCEIAATSGTSAGTAPERWHEMVRAYRERATQVVARFGGYVARYHGEELLVYFGYPSAHDDDAERAVRAALALIDTVRELPINSATADRLDVRIGVHSGPVVVGEGAESASEVFGETPNIAAHVRRLASPGTVLMTAATHRLTPGRFVVEDHGPQPIKGVAEPLRLFHVVRPSPERRRLAAVTRGHTPFVGREQERLLLHERFGQAQAGQGQVVLLTGEPGIGKSRLAQMLREELAATPHTWLEAGGLPYFASTPFYALTELLKPLLAGAGADDAAAQLDALERAITPAGLTPADAVPLVAPLLDLPVPKSYPPVLLSPEGLRRRRLEALAAWFLGEARRQPLVVLLEDLQWVDPSTLDLLQLLVQHVASAPMLLLLTARPEFDVPWLSQPDCSVRLGTGTRLGGSVIAAKEAIGKSGRALRDGPRNGGLLSANGEELCQIKPATVRPEEPPSFGGVSKGVLARKSTVSKAGIEVGRRGSNLDSGFRRNDEREDPEVPVQSCTVVRLGRLSSSETREMITRLTPAVAATTAPSTLSEHLVDAVVARTDGVPFFIEELTKAAIEADTSGAGEIPATLQGSLMARLDRLGGAKTVAQVGAVCGREFTQELLASVHAAPPDELQAALAALAGADLVSARAAEGTYAFKHALVQEAAYHSLLKSHRRVIHGRVAKALSENFPAIAEAQPELLAHHYTEAHEAEPAAAAWQRAGDRALARSAASEATSHLRRGLAVLATLPENPARHQREMRLQLALGQALLVTKGYAAPETAAAFARAKAVGESLGDPVQTFVFLMGLFATTNTRDGPAISRELADQAMAAAEHSGLVALRVWAHFAQGLNRCHSGELAGAREHLTQALALYDEAVMPHMPVDVRVTTSAYLAIAEWNLGLADQARAQMQASVELAERTKRPTDRQWAEQYATALFARMRDPEAVLWHAQRALAACAEETNPVHEAGAQMARGWALAEQGRAGEGIAVLRAGLDAYWASGTHLAAELFTGLLADALARAGNVAEAYRLLTEAEGAVLGEELDRADTLRRRAELLARLIDTGSAPRVAAPGASQGDGALLTPDDVERLYRDAIAVARRLGAKAYELRAASSYARWLRERGRGGEGRALLAPLYAAFTEGFDTPDLQDARALLALIRR